MAQCEKAEHASQPLGALAQPASGAVQQYTYGPHDAQRAGAEEQSTGGGGSGGGGDGDGGGGDGGAGSEDVLPSQKAYTACTVSVEASAGRQVAKGAIPAAVLPR